MPTIAYQICREIYRQDFVTGQSLPAISPSTPFGVLSSDWFILMALAFICSLFILVLVWLFATFLRNNGLLMWAKFELFQIFGTAVIVLFCIMSIVGGSCTFDMSFLDRNPAAGYFDESTGHGRNMYEITQLYFDKVEGLGKYVFANLMFIIKQVNLLARASWPSHPLGVGSVNNPLESLTQLNSLFFVMLSGYVVSFLLLQLQMRMLDYLAIASLYYFMPFGIFFRAFEPTRSFGGTLIALAIAMFLFYPIIIVFNDYLIARPTSGSDFQPIADATAAGRGQIAQSEQNADQNKLPDGDGMRERLVMLGDDSVRNQFLSNITGGMFFLFKPVMLYFIAAVVLPVINFIVLVEITRGITHTFGEEVDVSNLTRLI